MTTITVKFLVNPAEPLSAFPRFSIWQNGTHKPISIIFRGVFSTHAEQYLVYLARRAFQYFEMTGRGWSGFEAFLTQKIMIARLHNTIYKAGSESIAGDNNKWYCSNLNAQWEPTDWNAVKFY